MIAHGRPWHARARTDPTLVAIGDELNRAAQVTLRWAIMRRSCPKTLARRARPPTLTSSPWPESGSARIDALDEGEAGHQFTYHEPTLTMGTIRSMASKHPRRPRHRATRRRHQNLLTGTRCGPSPARGNRPLAAPRTTTPSTHEADGRCALKHDTAETPARKSRLVRRRRRHMNSSTPSPPTSSGTRSPNFGVSPAVRNRLPTTSHLNRGHAPSEADRTAWPDTWPRTWADHVARSRAGWPRT